MIIIFCAEKNKRTLEGKRQRIERLPGGRTETIPEGKIDII